jgi:anti-sigma factor (TIGR02949 family)
VTAVTNWLKKNIISKYIMSSCPEEQRCLHVLEVSLDDESTKEEEKKYFEHIEKCWTCYQNYNLEKEIRELIRTKIENKSLPEGLVQQIKLEIEKATAT